MKSLRLYILALCLASVFTLSAGAQDLSIWPVRTLQSAATGTGNGTAIESAATGAVSVQITGTFSATVTFEGSIDGSNWIALMATNANDDSRATTATAAGIYSVVLNGSTSFRARISSYSSGNVTVKARLTSGSVVKLGGGAGGGTVNSGTAKRLAYYSATGTTVDDAAGFEYDSAANWTLSQTPAAGKTGLIIYEPGTTPPASIDGNPVLLHLHYNSSGSYYQLGYSTGSGLEIANYASADGGLNFDFYDGGIYQGITSLYYKGVQTYALSATYFGGFAEVSSDVFGLMLTTQNPDIGAIFPFTWTDTGVQVQPVSASAGGTGELRFLELAANGANYVGFKAADALAGNTIWTLPATDGSSGQLLSTNGSGVLSWATAGGDTPGGSGSEIQYRSGATSLGAVTGSSVSGANVAFAPDATTGNGLAVAGSAITSGNLVLIAAGGTAAASNTKTALNVSTSGANATSTQTTYGAQFSNTSTGTSSTNVAGYFTASGGTNNYAIQVGAGQILAASGSSSAAAYAFTASGNSGMYYNGGNVEIVEGGRRSLVVQASGAGLYLGGAANPSILFGSGINVTLRSNGAGNLVVGSTAAASPVAQTLSVQDGTGTNIAGATFSLRGSLGTSQGAPGRIHLTGGALIAASGTTTHTAVDRIVSGATKVLTNNSATSLVNATAATETNAAGVIDYAVEVLDGTDVQYEVGSVAYGVSNKGGVFSGNTATKFGNHQNATSGTLTVTFAISGANPAVLSVNANSSLTPSTGYPRITYTLRNLTQQSVAVQ